MKALIVMPLAEVQGGAETALRQLMQGERDHGVNWSVVFLEEGPLVQEFLDAGISVSVVPAGRLRHLSRFVRSVARLRSIARREHADVVFSWMTKAHLYGGIAALTARRPAVWYQHGIPGRSWMDRLATVLPARGVIATSSAAAAAQARLRPRRAVRIVHPGIDLARFDPDRLPSQDTTRRELGLPTGVPLVGFFGRLQEWKGAGALVDAIPRVMRTHPEVTCLIVGGTHALEPEYPERLRNRIAALGLEERVFLAGFQPDVPRWMHAMDVIALPSRNEPFGITVVEAMAMGRPVVAGDSGGPTEVVESGTHGVLVPPDDSDAIADAIIEYVSHPHAAHRVGCAAREHARAFSSQRYASELAHAVRELAR